MSSTGVAAGALLLALLSDERQALPVGRLVAALSGGKDSTAMALRLAQLGVSFSVLYTPTGNELPGVDEHVRWLLDATGAPLLDVQAPTLEELVYEQQCLPSFRMRWCTRMIKIEPALRWLAANPGTTLLVGLRADEEARRGLYDLPAGTTVAYPLRDWGWAEADVLAYLDERGVVVPSRTDCAACYYQTLHEWWKLWRHHPERYAQAEAWEAMVGHTLRSPARDTWPAALSELRAEFEAGRRPRQVKRRGGCRLCNL